MGLTGIDKESSTVCACRVCTESRDIRTIVNANALTSVKSPYAFAFGSFAPVLA